MVDTKIKNQPATMESFVDTLIMSNKYNTTELRSILDLPGELSLEDEDELVNRIYDELREVEVEIEVDQDLNVSIRGANTL